MKKLLKRLLYLNKKNILLINISFVLLFLQGCGNSSSTTVIPTPSTTIYEINGNVLKITTGENLQNSQFFTDKFNSFLTDARGDFTFFYDLKYNNYVSFYQNTGLRVSFFIDILVPSNNDYKIFINNDNSFFVNNLFTSDEYNKIRVLLDYFEKNEFNTVETECNAYILQATLLNEYKKILYILRDFAIINQDFSRISDINTILYYSASVSSSNYISAREIYGGILYCIKSLLYIKDSYGIQKSIDFLEKIRLDELSIANNTCKIFEFTSDDLKSLLLLGYIYKEDSLNIDKFRSFNPQDTGSFSFQIKQLLNDLGFLREN